MVNSILLRCDNIARLELDWRPGSGAGARVAQREGSGVEWMINERRRGLCPSLISLVIICENSRCSLDFSLPKGVFSFSHYRFCRIKDQAVKRRIKEMVVYACMLVYFCLNFFWSPKPTIRSSGTPVFLDADFIASFIKNEQSNFFTPLQNFNDAQ